MKKALTITAVLIALLAGYLLYRYFFYTCCALPPTIQRTGGVIK